MNKQILKNSREDFILKYTAAHKAKLTREQLSKILGILPKSLLKKKSEIYREIGIELPTLSSDRNSLLDNHIIEKYESVLNDLASNILKIERVNDVRSKTQFNINKNKRYVITSAQNNTPINDEFLKSLKTYCEHNEAKLMVIPFRYRNPTSIWSQVDQQQDFWHKSVSGYLIDSEIKVGKHVRIMGNIKIQPTATSPLSGFDSITGLDSAIFGHPNIEWKTLPAVPGKLPKIMLTTGAVTVPNYTDSKAGHKGAYHHNYAAIVLEIDDNEIFHVRHLIADEKNGFFDLDRYYVGNKVSVGHRALALVAGDIHSEMVDDVALNNIFIADDSIANVINPSNIILHDILDFGARSHWNIRDALGRYRRHLYSDNNNVEEALQKVADLVERITRDDAQNWVIRSNHDEHIERWLREADPDIDPENAKFFHYLKYHQYKAIYEGKKFDVLKFWCQNPDEYRGMSEEAFVRTNFLSRNESVEIGGYELALHGDIGPNGSRGSLRNLSKIGQKIIIGHSHTPGIINGSYQVGTTSKLQMDYNLGPSSWLHTCAVLYSNGTVTLVNIIGGKWRL